MIQRKHFKRVIFFFILTIFSTLFSYGQNSQTKAPYENKLLNGLRLLVWTEPTQEKTTIKLRIHSGASFDPKDKMGVMALLGDILFPTDQSKEFFKEDLEGSLDIATTYDYIQITATGKSSEVLAMIQTIANAVVTPQINADIFKTVQAARLKKVQELEKNPTYIADRAVAKRLLGDFPYGRTTEGTSESLAKIDYADLLFAKDRFLTADNATITIIGNAKPDFVYRATRQLFGNWTKADKKVPATFAMPNAPDLTPQKIAFTPAENQTQLNGSSEIRFALRGIARNDKDYWAWRFLADVLQNRLRAKLSTELQKNALVVLERNLLPSYLSFKISLRPMQITENSGAGIGSFTINPIEILSTPISTVEFDQTRAKIVTEIDQKPLVDKYLDVQTFKLLSVDDEIKKLNAVTQADLQRVLGNLAKQPIVSVSLNAAK
jgi:predicted Zn-dependent peptidase